MIGGLVYLQFMPLDIAKYEALATQRVGQPVKIGSGSISLIPTPAIQFENVTIGAGKNVTIATVAATPEFGRCSPTTRSLTSLEISPASRSMRRASPPSCSAGRKATALGIQEINATGVKIVMPGLNLPELDATVTFQVRRRRAEDLRVQSGQDDGRGDPAAGRRPAAVDASIGGANTLFGLPFEVESVSAKGVATASEFAASELDAKMLRRHRAREGYAALERRPARFRRHARGPRHRRETLSPS